MSPKDFKPSKTPPPSVYNYVKDLQTILPTLELTESVNPGIKLQAIMVMHLCSEISRLWTSKGCLTGVVPALIGHVGVTV